MRLYTVLLYFCRQQKYNKLYIVASHCTIIDIVLKNIQISNFTKIGPVAADLYGADERTERQADRQTDTTKLTNHFLNFAKGPKTNNIFDKPSELLVVLMKAECDEESKGM